MAELLLVQALALGLALALVHWSPQDLAPPLVLGLVLELALVLAGVWAAASALQKALA